MQRSVHGTDEETVLCRATDTVELGEGACSYVLYCTQQSAHNMSDQPQPRKQAAQPCACACALCDYVSALRKGKGRQEGTAVDGMQYA